jgi:hypothetical protein
MSQDQVAALLHAHLERYPEARIADVYKLLHQSTFGIGHLITSKKTAREWLDHEIGRITPAAGGAVAESIHPDGLIVRLHLRPYLGQRGSVKALLDAIVSAAKDIQGDPGTLRQCWGLFVELCQSGDLRAERFSLREVRLMGQMREREGWPAVHHSPEYNSAYQPVYRVLTRDGAEALCHKQAIPFDLI